MIDELEVLRIVINRLESAGLRYMVTGSIAANFYTTPRMTRDIDLVIELEEKDIEKFQSLFSDDFYVEKESIRHALDHKASFNIIHREGIVKVDFTLQLHKNYMKREVGVLESLYSGTFKRFATKVSSIPQRSPQVTSNVPHKT